MSEPDAYCDARPDRPAKPKPKPKRYPDRHADFEPKPECDTCTEPECCPYREWPEFRR